MVDRKSNFMTTYHPLLVNVACEYPLGASTVASFDTFSSKIPESLIFCQLRLLSSDEDTEAKSKVVLRGI